jgi:hypothetical protein
MKPSLILLATLLLGLEVSTLAPTAQAQSAVQDAPQGQTIAALPIPVAGPAKQQVRRKRFELTDGTEVRLKFIQALSSKTARADASITFEVAEDVQVGTKIVITKGSKARGTVLNAEKAGIFGKKGSLDIQVRDVELVSGERIKLRSIHSEGGGNNGGVLAAAAVVNPLFLLIKGKNVTYEPGTEFIAFVDGDFELEPSNF